MPAGRLIKIEIDDTVLVGLRSVSRSTEADMAEATTAESTNQWKEFEPLYKGQTLSAEGLVVTGSDNETPEDLYDLIAAGTKVTCYYGGLETGDTYYEADAYISSLEEENSYDDLQSYSCEIQITGEPTKDTVSA
ncbi:MAG: phage tail tube protein [Perlabentimonas sp.]